jgi:hypothetical protein
MSWRARLGGLLGGKPAPRPVAKAKAKTPDRAQLIADAMATHHRIGAPLRADLTKALKALEDRRTLRDPEALQRLLALAQARKAIAGLLSGGLRRYVVLAGLRQWNEGAGGPGGKPATGRVTARR